MANEKDIERYRKNLQGEIDNVMLYGVMAAHEKQEPLAEVYRRLAAAEEKHAQFWEGLIRTAGGKVLTRKPSLRARLLKWTALGLGPSLVLPAMAASEKEGQTVYDHQPESRTTDLPASERSHVRVLGEMLKAGGKLEGGMLAQFEGRHRMIGGNALRAAVLGANDGLVSNLSLVMGVAGAQMSSHSILITGIAGLLAGACSMAIGEWLSVQSAREYNLSEIQTEAEELALSPEGEQEELALIYQAKGLPETEAKAFAARIIQDKSRALDTLVREELGIDPEELGGSAWEAAFASFGFFAVGAIIPVSVYFFLEGNAAVRASLGASSVGLFLIGAAIAVVTGRETVRNGIRQLLLGLGSAGITYLIGHLIGVQLGG